MDKNKTKQLGVIFSSYPEVKLAYLFGSRAEDRAGPLSDYDFALFMDGADRTRMSEIKLGVMEKVAATLGTDKVDIVILNLPESPELQYSIIRDGKLIYELKPFRILAEPRIMNRYFDFRSLLLRHHLTQP